MSESIFVGVAGFALAARAADDRIPEGVNDHDDAPDPNDVDTDDEKVDPRSWFPALR